MKMTLAAALRYKKRVGEKIAKLEADVIENNSITSGAEREADIKVALDQRAILVDHLTLLKVKMAAATQPIFSTILEIAEQKGLIAFYRKLNTKHGKVEHPYEDKTINYEAVIRKTDKDKAITVAQEKIDQLQAVIDAFNSTTSFEIGEVQPI